MSSGKSSVVSTYTTTEELETAYTTLFSTFKSGITKDIAWRKWQLKQVWWMIADNEDAFLKALNQDLHRHDFESYSTDLLATKNDILEHIQKVEKWAADDRPQAGFIFGKVLKEKIRRQPLTF